MSWADELCELYEKNKYHAGVMEYKPVNTKKGVEMIPYVLLPPFHTTVTAQITVTIDEHGNFLQAEPVDNGDKLTIIPVTEKSGSRTASKEPHPFCDNLKYVAGDYVKYSDEDSTGDAAYYELYIQALEKWHTSLYTHKKVDALYLYLEKGCLIRDLAAAHVLKLDENGKLSKNEKIQNIPQSKAFVRFRIMETFSDVTSVAAGQYRSECWVDQTLQNSFIEYYRSLADSKGICYLSGHEEQISYLHSKKIRNEGDGAKLISCNDSENFTYRGHFSTKEQAFAIGNETSQKVHNALKWIIRKQGYSHDTLTIVTWETNLLPMPQWDKDTDEICSDYDGFEEEDDEAVTNARAAQKFYQALDGYGRKLEGMSRMILMAFDAATTGRLALVEYKALESTRYLENIKFWHTECQWVHHKRYKKAGPDFWGMVGIRDIADILYGTESNGMLTILDRSSKRMYANISKQLLPCIWDRSNVPPYLMNLAVSKASSPVSYKESYNWERVLTLACSLIKKHRHEKNHEEVWTVALDKDCRDRNYLYGRLLAVADRVEYRTFDPEKDDSRTTNARRYMTAFSQRPYETWKVIEENLPPYYNKLKRSERLHYQRLMDEICQLFDVKSFSDNSRLDPLYLLGFHSQSHELKEYKNTKSEED